MLTNSEYNPDVLSCIASLSSDEIFTPPKVANLILDLLPSSLWSNMNARFLDPSCKSGVFLREIAKRLDDGLKTRIPNRQERFNHIFSNQLFAIAITELTALISRRSLYCSKNANGPYSVCEAFETPNGNIHFKRINHTWINNRCKFCGTAQPKNSRTSTLETHAYQFIHGKQSKGVLDMKFDVIVGNPPYQMASMGGTRDIPIYNLFVEKAKMLQPRYLCMIIPSRWMASGLGLSDFRRTMLSDRKIRKLVDHPISSDVFPGVSVEGGICYFLWNRDSEGDCAVTTIRGDNVDGPVKRKLDEFDVFVRDSSALGILHKVLQMEEPSMTEILSVDKQFGWTSNFDGFHTERPRGGGEYIAIYYQRKGRRGSGFIEVSAINKSSELVNTWKVMVPQAHGTGNKIPYNVLGQPFVAPNPSVCTQTFLFFYVDSKNKAESIESYVRTRFFRFLVSLRKITQHATRSTYKWVPQQQWNCAWNDDMLYKKYGLTKKEISFIESRVKLMESKNV